jgi:DNA-binding NarL/FixJ family response regulator
MQGSGHLDLTLQARVEFDAPSPGKGLTCVVADDHPAVLDVTARFLDRRGVGVVGITRDALETVRAVQQLKPDVAVVDLVMPGLTGSGLITALCDASPRTAIVVFTGIGEEETIFNAIAAGARAAVLKGAWLDALVTAVRAVGAGGVYVDALLAEVVVGGDEISRLSPRERDVLGGLFRGEALGDVAAALGIRTDTACAHVRNAIAHLAESAATANIARAVGALLLPPAATPA